MDRLLFSGAEVMEAILLDDDATLSALGDDLYVYVYQKPTKEAKTHKLDQSPGDSR